MGEKNTENNKKAFRQLKLKWKKRVKAISMFTVLAVATTVMAALLGFYVLVETSVNVGSVLEFDDVPAEDLLISRTISGTPGANYSYYHWLNLSSDSDTDLSVRFIWNVPEGIEGYIFVNDIAVSLIDLEPGDNIYLEERICLDLLIAPGVYSVNYTIVPHNFGY